MFEDITRVSQLAKERAKINPEAINATLGVLLDDNNDIIFSETFDSTIPTLTPKEKFPYEDVSGPKDLRDKVLEFLHLQKFQEKNHFTMITAGGTGSLSNVISVFRKNAGVVISNLCWNNYLTIAKVAEVEVFGYETFKDNKYNIDAFEEALNAAIEQKENVIVLINTPSHNPTGYDISNEEMQQMVQIINNKKYSGKTITVILDIAYYHFGINQSLDPFLNIDSKINLAIAYSFSKSFGIYGFRLGALIMIGEEIEKLEKVFYSHTRTKWSNPNRLGCSALSKVLNSEELTNRVYKEINIHRALLETKTKVFKEALNKNNIVTFPFVNGFFLSIPTNDPENVALKLSQQDVFVTTVNGGIRVAISGVPTNQLETLADKIKEALEE